MNPFPFIGSTPDLTPHLQKVLDGEYEICGGIKFSGDPIVLDLGGNVGAFAYYILAKYSNAYVISFEPNTANQTAYMQNLEASGVEPWRYALVCGAVYPSEEKTLTLHESQINGGMHSYYPSMAGRSVNTFTTPCIHPRRLPNCTWLKMDIEGVEGPVLRSYLKTHTCLPRVVSFEFHSRYDQYELTNLLGDEYILASGKIIHPDMGTLNFLHKSVEI